MRNLNQSKREKIANFIVKQIRENRTRFFTVICFVLGIVILTIFVLSRLETRKETSSDRLAAAYMALMTKDDATAIQHLDSAIAYAGNTPASYQARIVKADIFIDKQEYESALELLKYTEAKGKPEIIRPLALRKMIYVYDQSKNHNAAIEASNEFIKKYPDSFLIKDVYIGLARFYVLTKSLEDAKRVYGEILTKFPATSEAETADKFLQEIK